MPHINADSILEEILHELDEKKLSGRERIDFIINNFEKRICPNCGFAKNSVVGSSEIVTYVLPLIIALIREVVTHFFERKK